MDKRKQTINNLKTLAARLAPTIYFRYLTLNWDICTRAPVIKLFENKPEYIWFDDFVFGIGNDWRGSDGEKPLCTINAENLVGTSLGGMSSNDDYSEFIVSNKERTN